MKRIIATFLVLGGLFLADLPALAADPLPEQQREAAQQKEAEQQREAQKELLAARSKELERKLQHRAIATRGPAIGEVARQNRLRRQQREVQALIRRLEAGENVAPGDVERLLEAR